MVEISYVTNCNQASKYNLTPSMFCPVSKLEHRLFHVFRNVQKNALQRLSKLHRSLKAASISAFV